jgi:hypothetical protein
MSIFQPGNPAINFKYRFTGALSFRAKLLLAMMLVVLAVTTATVYLAEKIGERISSRCSMPNSKAQSNPS